MSVQIALYKKIPTDNLKHFISHIGICLWTFSIYSHAELVIDGKCYSSSVRDKGVRSKDINLTSDTWDVIDIKADKEYALNWFNKNKGKKYDWRNIFRFVLPFLGQSANSYICFEAVSEMLNWPAAHKLTGKDLYLWAIKNKR